MSQVWTNVLCTLWPLVSQLPALFTSSAKARAQLSCLSHWLSRSVAPPTTERPEDTKRKRR